MIVYRITKEKYAYDLSGEGSKIWGGRWNSPGHQLLYTSVNASLALLEVLAWTTLKQLNNGNFVILEIVIDSNSLRTIKPHSLQTNWDDVQDTTLTRELGDNWIVEKSSLCLKVPSAILSLENNLLINPLHDAISKVSVQNIYDVKFDKRIFSNMDKE